MHEPKEKQRKTHYPKENICIARPHKKKIINIPLNLNSPQIGKISTSPKNPLIIQIVKNTKST